MFTVFDEKSANCCSFVTASQLDKQPGIHRPLQQIKIDRFPSTTSHWVNRFILFVFIAARKTRLWTVINEVANRNPFSQRSSPFDWNNFVFGEKRNVQTVEEILFIEEREFPSSKQFLSSRKVHSAAETEWNEWSKDNRVFHCRFLMRITFPLAPSFDPGKKDKILPTAILFNNESLFNHWTTTDSSLHSCVDQEVSIEKNLIRLFDRLFSFCFCVHQSTWTCYVKWEETKHWSDSLS